ncbi:MAG TPA: ABC transporter permease [Candidatus Dormibacteraeota bacterium]
MSVLPASIAQRELLEFGQRRRALLIKMAFPLIVGVPLLTSAAPPFYAAMALTMLITIIGALGTAAVLSRERATGLQLRYRLLPRRHGAVILERVAAAAAIDLTQLSLILLLLAARHPGAAAWWPALLLAAVGTVLFANVVGAIASTFTTAPGEVMLYVLLPLLPAFFLSGVFTPLTSPLPRALSTVLPMTYLHEGLLGALQGAPHLSIPVVAAGGMATIAASLLAAFLAGRRVLTA